jgi:hypothetical protein
LLKSIWPSIPKRSETRVWQLSLAPKSPPPDAITIPNLHGVLIGRGPGQLPELVNERIDKSFSVSVMQKVLKFSLQLASPA